MTLDRRKIPYYSSRMPKQNPFMTVRAAALRVGVVTQSVYDRVRAGKLASEEVYGRIVVSVEGVREWEAERTAQRRSAK